MASFTAFTEPGSLIETGTFGGTNAATQSIGGYDADAHMETAATKTVATRSGLGQTADLVSFAVVDAVSRDAIEPTTVVDPFDSGSYIEFDGVITTHGPYDFTPAFSADLVGLGTVDTPSRHTVEPTSGDFGWAEEDELESFREIGLGALIPMSFFRRVSGLVLDEDGEPILDAVFLVAISDFSTVGRVDSKTGRYNIILLRQVYDEFVLVVESGQSGVDYVWFESVDATIDQTETEEDLHFERRTISGLESGAAASFGGPLRG